MFIYAFIQSASHSVTGRVKNSSSAMPSPPTSSVRRTWKAAGMNRGRISSSRTKNGV